MKNSLATFAIASVAAFTAAPAIAETEFIDLDRPGALQDLQRERAADYRRVVGILRDAERLPSKQVEGWIRTAYGAESVQLSRLLMVSNPPKRRLAFSLGEVKYSATVTVSLWSPVLTPAQ